MSGAPGFVTDALGIALDHLALVAREACVPDSCETVAVGEMVLGRLPPPEHCMDSRLKQLSPPPRPPAVFLRDRSICLSRRFGLKVRLLVWHISRGLWNFSQGAIFEFPLCLAIAHQ